MPLPISRSLREAIHNGKIDRVKVLRLMYGHFGDVFPTNLLACQWRN